jgi:uncharacterized RDD family membrane protein YckC
MTSLNYAPYGRRAAAALVDFCVTWLAAVVIFVVGFGVLFSDTVRPLGVVLMVVGLIWAPAFFIFNDVIRQGKTGQTIGKTRLNIRLVREESGLPIGVGYAALRLLASYALNTVTAGLFWIVDYVFPAFDAKKQRVVDKMIQTVVVDGRAQSTLPPPTAEVGRPVGSEYA